VTKRRISPIAMIAQDSGRDAENGSDGTNSNSQQSHEQPYTWDDELLELRQRLEILELRRRHQPRTREGRMENDADATGCGNNRHEISLDITACDSKTINIMDQFELPESTYSFLISAPIFSIPFNAGILASALSLMCLVLVLMDELQNNEPGNPLGVPAGLPPEVRMAQYLGIIIGKRGRERENGEHNQTKSYVFVCLSNVSRLTVFFRRCANGRG
jgi:hypothetical protein